MKISTTILTDVSAAIVLTLCLMMIACSDKASVGNQENKAVAQPAGDKMQPAEMIPGQLLKDIAQRGAKPVLDNQFANGTKWDNLLDAMQEGIINNSIEWYSIAKKLGAHTDASKSEGLRITLARALADNPDFVLQHGDETFNIENLCTIPYIEAEPATVTSYLERLQANANKMKDEENKQAVMECLNKLQGMLSNDN